MPAPGSSTTLRAGDVRRPCSARPRSGRSCPRCDAGSASAREPRAARAERRSPCSSGAAPRASPGWSRTGGVRDATIHLVVGSKRPRARIARWPARAARRYEVALDLAFVLLLGPPPRVVRRPHPARKGAADDERRRALGVRRREEDAQGRPPRCREARRGATRPRPSRRARRPCASPAWARR